MSGVTQTVQNQQHVSVTSQHQGLIVSQLSDAILQRTVVEAFVKMVVCRKVTVQKISARDGQVLDTTTRQEEDKPVILEVNRHETTDNLLTDKPIRDHSNNIPFTTGGLSIRDDGDKIYIKRDHQLPDRSVNVDSSNKSQFRNRLTQTLVNQTRKLAPGTGSDVQHFPDNSQSRIHVQSPVLRRQSLQTNQKDLHVVPTALVQNYEAQKLNIKVEPMECILVDDEDFNVPVSSQISSTAVGGCSEHPVVECNSFNRLDRKDVPVWRSSHSGFTSDSDQKLDNILLNAASVNSESDDNENLSAAFMPEVRNNLTQAGLRKCVNQAGDPENKITESFLCNNVDTITPQRNPNQSHPYSCDLCDKKYRTRATLQVHVRTHTGDKPFHCPHCPKQFAQSCVLRCHLRIHTGEKPYVCSICGKAFVQKGHLTAHYQFHSGIRPFKCIVCEKKFFQKSDLRKHQRKHKQ